MARTEALTDQRELIVETPDAALGGTLALPESATGIVVFAHGSGSSRHSSRNQFVARQFNQRGLGTLLFDLLTAEEEEVDLRTRHLRFDIPLLARRVEGAMAWLREQPASATLKIGLFGASTGAAAALIAAANQPALVSAVVSRGGRPDLAGEALPRVHAPTLFLVGRCDEPCIPLNREAFDDLGSRAKDMQIIPGASHLFEEPGKLETVADLAGAWFERWLA